MSIYQSVKKDSHYIFVNFLFMAIPLSFILGNASLNICFSLFILYFIYKIIANKDYNYLNNLYLKLLLVFWVYLIFNSIFVNYSETTLLKSLSFIRFILLPFAIVYFLKDYLFSKKTIFYFYSILSSLISIDIIYQFFNGINVFGYPPKLCITISKESLITSGVGTKVPFDMPDLKISSIIEKPNASGQLLINCERFSGIFNNELIAGSFLLLIILPFLIFLMNFKSDIKYANIIFFITFFLIIFASIITGDRAPVLIFIISIFVLFLVLDISFTKKILSAFLLISWCVFIIFSTPHLKHRFIDWPLQTLGKSNQSKVFKYKQEQSLVKIFIFETQWGLHYLTAYDLVKENLFFGNGVKSFRDKCKKHNIDYLKEKYLDKNEFKVYEHGPDTGCSTHPHNLYLELLTDTGLIGFIMFSTFFLTFLTRIYLKTKNKNLIFFSIFSILVSFMFPFKPTGSFFSTWHGYLMWIIISFYLYWPELNSKKIK